MASPPLPDDVIVEILTRLPLQTLARSKLVSSTWNCITYQPTFTDLHLSRTQTALGYFIQPPMHGGAPTYIPSNDGGSGLSLSFLPQPVRIVACDRGIVLCIKHRRDKNPYVPEYYVCKPTTKEFTKISNPKTRFLTEKIAIVVSRVSPLKYKIIRVSGQRDSRPFRLRMSLPCEVYDSDLRAWKQLANIELPYDHIFGKQKPVIVGDEIVWLSSESFFVFDSFKETWEIRPLSLPDATGSFHLTKHEGKLCIVSDESDEFSINVWTMENQEWKKKKKKKHYLKKPCLGFPVAMKNPDVAVFAEYGKMRFFNFANGSSREVNVEDMTYSDVFFFCSDYELCNLINFNS